MTNPESREIKFRVFNKFDSTIYAIDGIVFCSDGKISHVFLKTDNEYDNYREKEQIELMQFTGLHDKNGKEIYEGDILNKQYDNMSVYDGIGIVEMGFGADSDGHNHGGWYGWKCEESSLDDVYKESEIIGNIYENPELVEKNNV